MKRQGKTEMLTFKKAANPDTQKDRQILHIYIQTDITYM